jgi:hypothetical protein
MQMLDTHEVHKLDTHEVQKLDTHEVHKSDTHKVHVNKKTFKEALLFLNKCYPRGACEQEDLQGSSSVP